MNNDAKAVKDVYSDREIRERLALAGASALSDAELIGILLREGTNGNPAIVTARKLLAKYGDSVLDLSRESVLALRQSEGLGIARASMLAAAFELAGRIARAEKSEPVIIRGSDDIEAIFVPLLSHLKHEELWIAYLTSGNKLIERCRVSQGSLNSLVTDVKIILKRAVELLASSVIIVHNHPSGVASPSSEDIELTTRLAQAAAIFDIGLLDHIIVAESGETYSFRKNKLL